MGDARSSGIADGFHPRLLDLEARRFVAWLETYRITPEVYADTGEIIRLPSIELVRPETAEE